MKKKLCSVVTILFMICVLLCINASAASRVAKIGSKTYDTIEAAFTAAKKGQTINLNKNVTVKEDLVLNLGKKKVALNLNGKKLTVKGTIELKKGTLTIKGKGTLSAAIIKNAGTLTIEKGTIDASIDNTGKLNIKGGKVTSSKDCEYAINMLSGNVSVSGGTIVYNKEFIYDIDSPELSNGAAIVVNGKAAVKVSGGKIVSTSEAIMTNWGSNGTISLSGGTYQCSCGGCLALLGSGKTTVTGGKYSIDGCWGVSYIHGDALLSIKGGTFTSDWTLIETYGESSVASVTGGTFTTTMWPEGAAMLIAFNGKINAAGGTFAGKNKAYLYWNGDGKVSVSKNVNVKTKNIQKKTEDVCGLE